MKDDCCHYDEVGLRYFIARFAGGDQSQYYQPIAN